MAKIEMSDPFAIQLLSNMAQFGGYSNSLKQNDVPLFNYYEAANNYPGTYIRIMKGVVPTNFSTLTAATIRATDVLATFKTSGGTKFHFTPTVLAQNPIIVNTEYVNATATGQATWFWWLVHDTTNIIHQIVGSVGVVGSLADLEIPDVNLVSGNAYRILNMKLGFPTVWNF